MRAFPRLSMLLGVVAMNADSKTGERLAPEFSHSAAGVWINSPPQSIAALRGRPVMIEFWTFDCIDCRRTLPWMKGVSSRTRRIRPMFTTQSSASVSAIRSCSTTISRTGARWETIVGRRST